MRVGEKLVCKKHIYIYQVGDIVETSYIGHTIVLIDKKRETNILDPRVYVSLNKGMWYIWDYFYTPKEERKLKLEKLNENR